MNREICFSPHMYKTFAKLILANVFANIFAKLQLSFFLHSDKS